MFSLLSITVFSQTNPPSFVTDSLDAYIEKGLSDWNIPGVAVLVVKDGEVIVSKGYGVREMGTSDAVDENTLFMIASNTKAFTGVAVSMMDYEGKCSLDDKVVKWLPDFKMKDPWVTQHLTLTDVMSHRIGMETFQGDFMYWESDLTTEQVIEKFGKLTPMYDFRTKWGYCNAGFVVAGQCLKQMSGLPWSEFVSERIIKPLQMDRTLVLSKDVDKAENICAAHTMVDGELVVCPRANIDNIAPAASISSSVNDLSHWVIALLDSGRYDGREVIPWQAIRQAQTPASIIGPSRAAFNETNFSLYGKGFELQDYEGRRIASHTGGTDGFVTSVTLIPEEKLGVVVLTNTDVNAFYQALKWEIIDSYLGLPYRNYNDYYNKRYSRYYSNQQKILDALRDTVALQNKPSVKLKKFEGRYVHDVYGWADLKAEKDYLVLTLQHHPELTGKLEYISDNRFLCTYSSPLWGVKVFPFVIENGKVKSFTLSVSDFLEYTTYDFIKQ